MTIVRDIYKNSIDAVLEAYESSMHTYFAAAIALTMPLAWITHFAWIGVVLQSSEPATSGQMLLSILGLIPPIGIMHGYVIWLGI